MIMSQPRWRNRQNIYTGFMVCVMFFIASCGSTAQPAASIPASPTATIAPSPTPMVLDPTQFPTVAQVWGKPTLTMRMPANFTFESLSDDGTKAFGSETTSDGLTYQAGWVNVSNGVFTAVESTPVKNPNNPMNDNIRPGCCMTDGRYVVGTNNLDEKLFTSNIWYYDTQTNQLHTITSTHYANINYDSILWVKDGIATYWTTTITGVVTIMQVNMATGVRQPAPFSIPPNMSLSLFLVESDYPSIMYGNGSSQYLFNTLTQQTINITSGSGYPWDGTIVGSNLIYMNNPRNSSKGGISDFNIQTKQTTILFSYTIPSSVVEVDLVGADERVVVLSVPGSNGDQSWFYEVIWDRTLNKWFITPKLPYYPRFVLNSHYLAYADDSNTLVLYAISKLPNS